MKRVIFLVLLNIVTCSIKSQNLIVNPGFETWSKINKPAGWTHSENCLKDSLNFISGDYSVMHSGGSTTSDLGQTINIVPGQEYMLSLYYKTIITSSGNGARIWCYWKDEEGNSVYDEATDATLRPSKYMKSEIWDQLTIKATAPPEARAFYLEVRTYPNSVCYWDDFLFEESIITHSDEENHSELRIYPNPSCNFLNIKNIYNLQQIDIHSLTGTKVWEGSFSGENTVSIPISSLPNGLYFIHIFTSTQSIIRTFIKSSH